MRACGGNSSSTNCNYDKAEIIFFHLFELDDLVVRGALGESGGSVGELGAQKQQGKVKVGGG